MQKEGSFPNFPILTRLSKLPGERHMIEVGFDEVFLSSLRASSGRISATLVIQTAWAIVLKILTASDHVGFSYGTSSDWEADTAALHVRNAFVGSDSTISSVQEGINVKRSVPDIDQPDTMICIRRATRNDPSQRQDTHVTSRRSSRKFSRRFCAFTQTSQILQVAIFCTVDVDDLQILDAGLTCFNTHLSMASAKHVSRTFGHLLSLVLEQPQHKIGTLDLLSPYDKGVLAQWNPLPCAPIEQCVHHMISEQCTSRPLDSAISAWDGDFSYRELDDYSSDLAHHLSAMEIARGSVVALLFSKTKWAIVAMLAAVKTGAAFAFLDPTYPQHRLQTIAKISGAQLTLCSSEQSLTAHSLTASVVCVDSDQQYWGRVRMGFSPRAEIRPTDPLYVVFTSGSTGIPKAVLVDHAAASTRATITGLAMRINRRSRILQYASFVFSAAIRDIMLILCNGGCLCIPSTMQRNNHITSFIADFDVNVVSMTPSTVHLILYDQTPTLEKLILNGESPRLSDLPSWTEKVQLMSVYGLSEGAGANALQAWLKPDMDLRDVGTGLGSAIWLVSRDNHDQLVPIGAVGEIVIESSALARGYLNDLARTQDSFIATPAWSSKFRGVGRARFYKTGDLGRYNADTGSIILLGRKDLTQVKIHGQQVHLDDIENGLSQSLRNLGDPSFDCLVTYVKLLGDVQPRLIACIPVEGKLYKPSNQIVLPSLSAPSSWKALGEALGNLVPTFMIPFAFLPVRHLPKTLSGKYDRSALRQELAKMSLADVRAYDNVDESEECPQGAEETLLRELWATVLRQEEATIWRRDNIFRRGADSVTVMMLADLSRKAGLELTVEEIFTYPVLADQASICSRSKNTLHEPLKDRTSYLPFSLVDEPIINANVTSAGRFLHDQKGEVEDVMPCTALQESMILHTLRSPHTYIAQHVYRLADGFSFEDCRNAWQIIIKANAILRTRIVDVGEELVQVVLKTIEISTHVHANLDEYLAKDKARDMQLREPLARFAFARKAKHERFCVVTLHHALFDLWSLRYILKQVEDACEGKTLDTSNSALLIRYLATTRESSRTFWKQRLNGQQTTMFPDMPLAQTMASPKTMTSKLSFEVKADSLRQSTLSTYARLAWALTIAHYTNSKSILYHAVVSGRGIEVAGISSITMPTVSIVPVLIDLSSDMPVQNMLEKVQNDFLSTMKHEHLGLKDIATISDQARSACQAQNLLVVQADDIVSENQYLNPLRTNDDDRLLSFGTYAMTLFCQIRELGRMDVKLLFDDRVISTPFATRCLRHFGHVLETITSHPEMLSSQIDSISPYDLTEIHTQNRVIPSAMRRCIPDIIFNNPALRTKADAIHAWDGTLSYDQLRQESFQFARLLISVGVTRHDVVPICMDKSRLVPVVMLAIVIAGASFTLVDMSHPQARIKAMVRDVRARVAITDSLDVEALLHDKGMEVLKPWQPCLAFAAHTLVPICQPDDCLYVAWTSGSTSGRSKGTLMSHTSYATAASSYQVLMNLTPASRVYQLAAYNFDVSILEILTTLMVGGCVCIPRSSDSQNRLADSICEMRATWLTPTPTVARLLRPATVPSLRTIVLGGERVTRNDIDRWKADCQVMIAYGPAECSICSTVHATKQDLDTGSIGRACGGVCWVVNPENHDLLVPIGAVGELLIEGHNVGLGYLNDPERTQAAFIESPIWMRDFRKGVYTRVYKTGDLVEYTSDGWLRYMGRKDDQRKLRGMRIQLTEIEHNLHDTVSEESIIRSLATDIVQSPNANIGDVLVAFCELGELPEYEFKQHPHTKQVSPLLLPPFPAFTEACDILRNDLKSKVPKHLIPASFVPVRSLPKTISQKVDRRLLREMCLKIPQEAWSDYSRTAFFERQGPSTDDERTLHDLVRRFLQNDRFSMLDDAASLGIDSIAAMRLSAMAQDADLSLAVSDILWKPSLVELAQTLRSQSSNRSASSARSVQNSKERSALIRRAADACGIDEDVVEDIYPCTSFQQTVTEYTRRKPGAFVARFAYSLTYEISAEHLERAWRKVYQANPVPRSRIVEIDGRMLQVVLQEDFSWSIDHTDHMPPLLDAGLGSTLSQLYMAGLDKTSKLILDIHHALYDGWSLALMLRQLDRAIDGHKLDMRSFSPIVEHLEAQDQHLMSTFWRAQLHQAFHQHFPTIPESIVIPHPNSFVHRDIVLNSAPVKHPTLIKLAWAILNAHFTQSMDICYLLVSWGRDLPVQHISEIVGPTIAEYPFRLQLDSEATLSQMLNRVQIQVRQTAPYQNFGFENIRALGEEVAAACATRSCLIIHPMQDALPKSTALQSLQIERVASGAFDVEALTIACFLSEASMRARLEFDERVITHREAGRILDILSTISSWLQDHARLSTMTVAQALEMLDSFRSM